MEISAYGKREGITIAGSLIQDVYYQIQSYPQEGLLTNVLDCNLNIGGTGNIILDLAKLDAGLKVKVCAVIGNDDNGKNLLSTLSNYKNINTDNISIGNVTSCTIIMNANDTKQRTFFFVPGDSDVFDLKFIDFEKLNTKIFHLEYLLLMKKVDSFDEKFGTHGARILYEAQKRGFITSIDVVSEQSDRAKNIVSHALKYTDICCINEFEAQSVTGINLVKDNKLDKDNVCLALQELSNLGVNKWAIIHSPTESYGLDVEQNKVIRVPSLDVPKDFIKGSTGAGDAYCAGVLYGAHEEFSLEESMRLARACSVCSLSQSNGTDGMRSYQETLKIEQQFSEKE